MISSRGASGKKALPIAMYRGPLKGLIVSERPYRLAQTVRKGPIQMKTAGVKDDRNSNRMAVVGQEGDD